MAKQITLSGGPSAFDKIRYDTPGKIWMAIILFELFMVVVASLMGPLGVLLYVLIHIIPSYVILYAGILGIINLSNKVLVVTFLVALIATWILAVSIISII